MEDDTVAPPPHGTLDQAGEWLLQRHPDLQAVLARLPGARERRGGRHRVDLNAVAAAMQDFDDYALAWAHYAREHPEPPPEPNHVHDNWLAAGPPSTPTIDVWLSMSSAQLAAAQLVAALSGARIPIRLGLLFEDPDPDTLAVLGDWLRAVEAARQHSGQESSRQLDRDLARWHAPGWVRLDLDPKTVEVIAHLANKPDATTADRARDLFPGEHVIRATANVQAACERVNHAASAATGKPGPLIAIPGADLDPRQPRPELRLHLMTAQPYLEVR